MEANSSYIVEANGDISGVAPLTNANGITFGQPIQSQFQLMLLIMTGMKQIPQLWPKRKITFSTESCCLLNCR